MSLKKKQAQLMYHYPPDLSKSQKHRNAMRIFRGIENDRTNEQCECCERRIGTPQGSGRCCFGNMDVAFLGPGIPLYFTFLRNSILLLLLLGIVFTAFAFYSNVTGKDCKGTDACSGNIFDTFAIINKTSLQGYLSIQNYTVLAFTIIFLFAMQGFRYSFRKVEDDCDDAVDSPSDYAMILRRLPDGVTKQDIEMMINERRGFLTPEERQKTENLRVVNIVMSFSMGEYTEAKNQNIQKFYQHLKEDKLSQFQPKELPELKEYASIAIVVFARQESKELFKYKPNICQKLLQCIFTPCIPRSDYQIKGQKIAIERAPEPDDIVWENAKISMCGAITRKSLYSILSIIMLIGGGAVQYGLAVASVKASQDERTQLIMSTASSLTVSVINALIQFVLVFTSHKERNETLTEYNAVLMVKISFFQFLNTGVFVVAANFLADVKGFSLSNGFVFEVCQVMMLNAVMPNLILILLGYFEVPQKIMRYLVEKQIMKKSQMDANNLWQGPAAEIPYKYAYIFKTIWLTAFYAPLVPLVVPVSIFGLIFNYILEKCLYGKSYSMPNLLSSMLNDSAIELLEYFPLIFTLGEFIIYLYMKSFHIDIMPKHWSIPIYISIGISILNLLLPMDELNNKLWKMPTDTMVYPNYEKVQEKFEVTYEMTNPGYVCERKRKRDLFVMHHLFAGHGMEMTNMGLMTGASEGLSPLLGQPGPGPFGQPGSNMGGAGGSGGTGGGGANPFGALLAGPAVTAVGSNNQDQNQGRNPPGSPQNNPQLNYAPHPNAVTALTDIKLNSARGKPLDMSMIDQMADETLRQENQNLNTIPTNYHRGGNNNILFGLGLSQPHQPNNSTQPGFQQPGFQQPGFQRSGFNQPGFNQPGFQPGFQQPGFQQPGFQQPSYYQGGPQMADVRQGTIRIAEQQYNSQNSNKNKEIKKQLKRSFNLPTAIRR